MLFINKVDTANYPGARGPYAALQTVSSRPWCCARCPRRAKRGRRASPAMSIWSASGHTITTRMRRPIWSRCRLPCASANRRPGRSFWKPCRTSTTSLLEQLLEDVAPDKEEIYRQLSKDLAADLIVPVFIGSAENDNGVRRLLKALRHETPEAEAAAARLEIPLRQYRGPGVQDLPRPPCRQAQLLPRLERHRHRWPGPGRRQGQRHLPHAGARSEQTAQRVGW